MSMEKVKIKVKRLLSAYDLPLPKMMTAGAAGSDICSAEFAIVKPGLPVVVGTGLCFEIPQGYEIQVRSRSGLAAKNGVFVLNSPGTIDSDYRGELKVILATVEDELNIRPGDRIAQLVVNKIEQTDFFESEELEKTERDSGGFGSTGV